MKSTRIEALRHKMHTISRETKSLSEKKLLIVACELDELVIREMKRRMISQTGGQANDKT